MTNRTNVSPNTGQVFSVKTMQFSRCLSFTGFLEQIAQGGYHTVYWKRERVRICDYTSAYFLSQ